MPSDVNTGKSDIRALLMLLASIYMAGAALSFDTPLVVKITAFYGITDSDFGFLLALTTFVIAISSAPWGYLADKYQRVKLIRISQGIIAVSMLLAGICLQWKLPYPVFFAVKLLSGVGLASAGSVSTSAVMDTVPLSKRGAAFGWVGVGWVLGGAGGMLMPSVCMLLKLSLGVTFLIGAAPGIAFTAALFFVKEPKRGAQDEALKDLVGTGKAEYTHHIQFSDIKTLLSRPTNILLMFAVMFFQFPGQVLAVWFVTFLMRNHGLDEFAATMLMFLAFVGQPFGNAIGGAWTDRAYRWKRSGRLAAMIAMAAFAPVFLIAAMLLPFKWIYFVPTMILANFFIVAHGPGITTVSMEVNLPEHRGTISALLNIWASVSRALAWWIPPIIAAAFGGRYGRAFVLTAAAYAPLIAIYAFVAFRVEKDLDHVNIILEERAKKLGN